DLHVIAYRLAEALSVPAMVCVDGFVLTHAFEPIELPDQKLVDRYLPSMRPRQVLDPDGPVTIGAMVGPDAFTEVRYLADHQLRQATPELAAAAKTWRLFTGRCVAAVSGYQVEGAETVVVTLGSVAGTVREAVQDVHPQTGVVTMTLFRPFPAQELRAALRGARQVIVLERAFAPGAGGVLAADVRAALAGSASRISAVVAGLGGRPVTQASVRAMLRAAHAGTLPDFSFLDLNEDVVEHELGRHSEVPGGYR
ncbi:MAG TPA: hypothetical protein VFU35_12110, partial [Jatrophihabitans sp.]|nr:hypothetical protein [Jatrophihabitans sp.]